MNPVFQRCPDHNLELLQRDGIRASKPTSGLWCPSGHWCEYWEVVDRVTLRVEFRATRKGGAIIGRVSPPVTVLVPRWACCCARCGHAWVGRCECMPIGEGPVKHVPECEPPKWCPACRDPNWQRAKGA
jgi:hypothetical protein